jgi:tetratricopeptide (TPR) repeat protein
MTQKEIQDTLSAVNRAIENNRLKDAFDGIKALLDGQQNWALTDRLNELETNYRYMIHYLTDGGKDPDQRNIYRLLQRNTYKLAQDAAENLCMKTSPLLFFEKSRVLMIRQPISINEYREMINKQMDTFAVLDLLEDGYEKNSRMKLNAQAHEHTVSDLFYAVFAGPRANDDLIESYRNFMNDTIIPINDKCMLVSALTMNVMQRFDSKKIGFMIDVAQFGVPETAIRAVIGLIPVFQIYASRWKLYPEIVNRLEVLADDPLFTRRTMFALIQYIQARETEKIAKKLTEEILPEMMKISPIIGKKINWDEWIGESSFDDKNPEWQKILDESGLSRKLEEFSELQLEGADVMHSTFSNLKSYPFFYEMSNWFLPFDGHHSQVQQLISDLEDSNQLLKSLIEQPIICNSDKYSFCFSIMLLPAEYRRMTISQLSAEGDEIQKMIEEGVALNPNQKEEMICRQYLQDLYRFHKLFSKKSDFIDIFALPLDFHKIEIVSPITGAPENLQRIAFYYFEKNHFEEALEAYTLLAGKGLQNAEVWQKIGYCRQMLGDIRGALDAYLNADLIDENNPWALRRIAQCYRLLKQPKDALEYYRRLEQLKPNDLNIQLNIGHCYLELKNFAEALNYYFKVELIDGSNTRAWRSIAWCAFLSRKFDIARSYYAKIIESKPNAQDYMNAGHVELCTDNIKTAIELYEQSLKLSDSFDVFISMLHEDKDELREAGVNIELLPIIVDKIKYDQEENQ